MENSDFKFEEPTSEERDLIRWRLGMLRQTDYQKILYNRVWPKGPGFQEIMENRAENQS